MIRKCYRCGKEIIEDDYGYWELKEIREDEYGGLIEHKCKTEKTK